jgi:hypothetical protein
LDFEIGSVFNCEGGIIGCQINADVRDDFVDWVGEWGGHSHVFHLDLDFT